jgi:hypothetical protein
MNNKQLIPSEDNLSDIGLAASAEGGAQMVREQPAAQLFPETECHDFRARWERIQVDFVDEPRRAVQEADGLVADTMKRLIDNFSGERKKMEAVWVRGDDVSTEDLRVSLQRYRSFFNRLLTL